MKRNLCCSVSVSFFFMCVFSSVSFNCVVYVPQIYVVCVVLLVIGTCVWYVWQLVDVCCGVCGMMSTLLIRVSEPALFNRSSVLT